MDPFVLLLLFILLLVAAASAVLAATNRLAFRIALRNARRGRWRTVLLLLGLLVGTTIVSGSLVIGDTVSTLNVHFTYQAYGYTDEAVYNLSFSRGYLFFPLSVYTRTATALASDPQVAGITPEVVGTIQALDHSTGVPQPGLTLVGANASQSGHLGAFTSVAGVSLAGPTGSGALLDQLAASDMNASVGDQLYLVGQTTVPVTVQAVVKDDTRGGFFGGGNVFLDLPTAQRLMNASGQVNFLAVTNAGPLTAGVGLSDAVSARLNSTLAQIPAARGLGANELLKDNLARAQTAGSSLETLFLVLGLFSIVAGGMLIVGIFLMLAEERKGEMGMLRATGLKRRQLVLVYYFEGLLYSAGSALAGTLLGVAVGYFLMAASAKIFASSQVTQGAILDSFTVTSQTLLVAYVVGFLLTLVTVALSSARVSRLNIVRAIRSIPEPPPTIRLYTYLAYLGVVLLVVGGLLFATSYQGTTDASSPLLGGALLIGGAMLLSTRFIRNRVAFSVGGAGLLVWGGSVDLHRLLLGTAHSGTIFVVFVEGILMILGAILLYVFNAPTVVRAVTRLFRGRPATVSVVRIALSHPSRRPMRTAVNLTIFSLVLFTVVAVAGFGASLQANLANSVRSESGGYTFAGFSQSSIPDLPGLIANNSTLRPLFSEVVPLAYGFGNLNFTPLSGPTPSGDSIYAAPAAAPATQNFYTTNGYNFTSTLHGESAQAVWTQVETNRSVAVVDHSYNAGGINFGGGPPHPTLQVGTPVRISNPDTGATRSVTVIGILSESFVGGFWVNPGTASSLGFHNTTLFFLSTNPGVNEQGAAQLTKKAFYAYGLLLYDFAQVLKSNIDQTEGFIGLLEAFVALGLAVGIAGMGIVALRAVVERRAEIGMLRASGFTRRMILEVFLVEYSYVALLGIGIGTALGIVLDYEATQGGGSAFLTFTIPWANLALVVVVAYALVIAAIIGPSIKAARLPPAEAVRYSE